MDALFVSSLFGLGLVFVFDALVRPEVRPDPTVWLRRAAPRSLAAAIGAAVGYRESAAQASSAASSATFHTSVGPSDDRTPTQAHPSPAAKPHYAPVRIVVARLIDGLTRTVSPSRKPSNHTAPSPAVPHVGVQSASVSVQTSA